MSKLIVDTLENTAGTFTSAIDSLGPSTAFGGVGSYTLGRPLNTTTYAIGDTASGIQAPQYGNSSSRDDPFVASTTWYDKGTVSSTSGTWRLVGGGGQWDGGPWGFWGLWVRIS